MLFYTRLDNAFATAAEAGKDGDGRLNKYAGFNGWATEYVVDNNGGERQRRECVQDLFQCFRPAFQRNHANLADAALMLDGWRTGVQTFPAITLGGKTGSAHVNNCLNRTRHLKPRE